MRPTELISFAIDALRAGNVAKARETFSKVLQTDPANALAWDGLGLALRAEKDLDGALDAGLKATQHNPGLAHAWSNLANTRAAMGDDSRALQDYKAAIKLNPEFAEAWASLGLAEARLGLDDDAIASLNEASRLFPRDANAQNTIGNQLFNLNTFENARNCYLNAVRLNPSFANAWNNLGNTCLQLLDLPGAIDAYEGALATEPGHAEAANGYAQALLMSGDFDRGWAAYEKRPTPDTRLPDTPVWEGQSLQGKSLTLICEQGQGDSLQFVRFAKQLSQRGATVLLDGPPGLTSLVAYMDGFSSAPHQPGPERADFKLPLLSLPHRLHLFTENDFRMEAPYIRIPGTDRPATVSKKVGLVWAGNPHHINDLNRSMSFSEMEPLLELERLEFHSFQQGTAGIMEPAPSLHNRDRKFTNWLETAVALEKMDVLITVDTAIAHLAGAMGVPCWLLLPYVPDWRWMLDRSDSPWYPGLRLYRQSIERNWESVVAEVKQDLEQEFLPN